MAKVVYLHVGAPKTGSSYLQNILSHNSKRLARDGVLYSGAFYASLDLRGAKFQGYDDPKIPGAWQRLVDRTRKWNGTAVVSHENLASAEPEHVAKAVADFGSAEVHVVYTARDLARQIPAVWQEGLKNRGSLRFSDFVQRLKATQESERGGTPGFWRSQDAVRVLEPWARQLGPERIHVVTVPPTGAPPRQLWERFSSVIGIPPDDYEIRTARTNSSLGAVEAALLRRLNKRLRKRVSWPVYQRVVKRFVAHDILAARSGAHRIALPDSERDWVDQHSRAIVAGLRAAGYQITGDLDELLSAPSSGETVPDPDDVSVEQELAAAVDVVTGLVRRIAALQRSQRQLRARANAARRGLARGRQDGIVRLLRRLRA